MEDIQKVFEVMCVDDAKRVDLASYHLKGVAKICYDQWKKRKEERAPLLSWDVFENNLLGHFFPREIRKAKMIEFLNLK